MNINISLLSPHAENNWKFISDSVDALYYSLCDLGHKVSLLYNETAEADLNIICGLQDLKEFNLSDILSNSIIYNFEPANKDSKCLLPHYLKAMRSFPVWDYSQKNSEILRAQYKIKNIQAVQLGYHPKISRINTTYHKDIDVLFYGTPSPRREKIITQLKVAGVNVVSKNFLYGPDRDLYIARSKLVLNIHYYTPGILEVVRLNYLLANHKAVISECNKDTELPGGYEDTCLFYAYDGLVDGVLETLKNHDLLLEQEEKAFDIFSNRPYTDTLLPLVGRGKSSDERILPDKINAGSGYDFKPDCLNIDISAGKFPDILTDLCKPMNFNTIFTTKRFGDIKLKLGAYSVIYANDILEHVPDLTQMMTNFLHLLKVGGVLHIHVPYDLSLGAWQDPTHLRAFNQNSWLYYTDWSSYIGWNEYRFKLVHLQYELSRRGRKLKKRKFLKIKERQLLHMPRMVEFMNVKLVKCTCDNTDAAHVVRLNELYL